MAACAGILFTEVIGKPNWWDHAKQEYWMPIPALFAIQMLIVGALETKRFQGWKETGTSGFLNAFPFDPAGMNSPEMAVKEVKNGRLAMVAFIGFVMAALVCRKGPIAALTYHLSSPFEHNIGGSIMDLPSVIGQ